MSSRQKRIFTGVVFVFLTLIGLVLLAALGAGAQTPKTPPLELKVADGHGARCILKPIIQCGLLPTSEHGSILFEYNPDQKVGWVRINRPGGAVLVGHITNEIFTEHGNTGTLFLFFEGGVFGGSGYGGGGFTGTASFTLYPFHYNYTNPGQQSSGIMLTSGAVRVTFGPEAQ
jgi:hypothetical protein